jgi:hypothetical protein
MEARGCFSEAENPAHPAEKHISSLDENLLLYPGAALKARWARRFGCEFVQRPPTVNKS